MSIFQRTNKFVPRATNEPFPEGPARLNVESSVFVPDPVPIDMHITLTEEEADQSILPIMNLLNSETEYNQTMALEVLYELSDDVNMRPHMARNGCYDAIVPFYNSNIAKQKLLAHKIQVNEYKTD